MAEPGQSPAASPTPPPESAAAAAAAALVHGSGAAEAPSPFHQHAQRVLAELRDALAALVNAAPLVVRRAVDLQRALELDAPLAWRVYKVATADDPLLSAQHVPSRGQLMTFLEAAGRHGLPGPLVERARGAVGAYLEFSRRHAGDRAALDAMIAALRPREDDSQIDERTRRTAFQQNARIWGLQAQAAVRAFIVHPGPDQAAFGTAAVAGLIGLHAVRPDVPLIVHAVSRFESNKRDDPAMRGLPTQDRSGLLLEYSSPGLEYRTEPGDDQTLVTRVCASGIGRQAAVNTFSLTTSQVPAAAMNRLTLGHGTSTPVEVCHLELLAPAGLTDPRTARVGVYGRRTRVDRVIELRPDDLLPIRGTVVHVGSGSEVPPISGVPRWPEVVGHVLERIGAAGARFDIYRCRVPFPVLHTLVCMQVEARAGAAPPASAEQG